MTKSPLLILFLLVAVVGGIVGAGYFVQSHILRPNPTPVADFNPPSFFGRYAIPIDNPLTEEAFELGRHLFYDPRLSGTNEMSCANCHQQELAFTDGLAFSVGTHGGQTKFSSMSLANLLWGPGRFFWDGRADSLEQQVLQPIEDPIEMDQDLDLLLVELEQDDAYPEMFRAAYGEISSDAIAKALSTFIRMLVSAESKYDAFLRGETSLTEKEELGRKLFMAHPDVSVSLRGGNCIDCHGQFHTAGFSDGLDGFVNNGLDGDDSLKPGLMLVTADPRHKGAFKTPSLRNIAVTGPYMHDGRFKTLGDVLRHYNEDIKHSATVSPLILQADNTRIDPTASFGLNLTESELQAIEAFLHTLTDNSFLSDPRFSNPFSEELK